MANTTIIIDGVDPLIADSDGKTLLKTLINHLQGLLGGNKRANSIDVYPENDGLDAATGTVTAAAVQAGDTVTINGQAITATTQKARGTVTTVVANTDVDDTVTILGEVFTAKAAEDTGAGEFDISGTDAAAATSLAACLAANAVVSAAIEWVVASNVVHMLALAKGTGGNAYTLATSDADGLVISGANFTGGAAVANNQFDFHAQFNDYTAEEIARTVNDSTTDAISTMVEASSASAVATITALEPGFSGNAITFVSSNGSRLAVSGSGRLAGGDEDPVIIEL